MKKKFILIGISLLSMPLTYAYLDPGTGGVILSSIWPLIVAFFAAAVAFIVKWFWKPIKRSFSKLISRTKK